MSAAMTNTSTNPAQPLATHGVVGGAAAGTGAGVSGGAQVDVPRLAYALVMVGAGAIASGLAWMLAGNDPQRGYAAGIIGVGALVSLMPALMSVAPTRWSMVVLATFTVRNLLFAGAMLGVIQLVDGVDRRPFLLGVVAGAGLILLVETMLTISILSWLDRNKAFAQKPVSTPSPSPPPSPMSMSATPESTQANGPTHD